MTIVLRVERVIVDDALAVNSIAALRESLENELAKQLASAIPGQAWQRIGSVPSLPPTICSSAHERNDGLGPRVASAVVKQLQTASVGTAIVGRGPRHG